MLSKFFYRINFTFQNIKFVFFAATSLLAGKIVFGNLNGIAGSSSSSLNTPWGITINTDNSILIADAFNGRVLLVRQNSSDNVTIFGGGGQLGMPAKAIYDTNIPPNLYIIDCTTNLITVWQSNSTTGMPRFGSQGSNLNQLHCPASFYLSSNKSFYIADEQNHRILLLLWNASNGIVIAGVTDVIGNDSFHLNLPADIFVDEELGQMYVADSNNHRIIRYTFGSLNGTVVAGGNGQGKQRK